MSIPAIILLVFLGIIAVLLVLIVLVQNEEGDGMGGLLGGGSGSAFGPRSGNILTRITSVLAVLFFGIAFIFSILLGQGTRATELDESKSAAFEGATFSEKVEQINSADEDEAPLEVEDETETAE